MKHFEINTKRDILVPDLKCYQMDLSGPVNAAIEAKQVSEDFKELPSWGKFIANPSKSKGFYTRVLEGLFKGQHGFDELNVGYQLGNEDHTVSMIFMPANTRNDCLKTIAQITEQTLDGFNIITLCGDEAFRYNGQRITNKSSEKIVKEVVEKSRKENKSTLILAAQLAQRSFSIPEITNLFLAYDNGEMGSTLQKISRVLTPNKIDKVGHVFSLSFDPNRDDKFDAVIVETAINYKNRNGITSLYDAMKDVLKTIDIFTCQPDGAIKIDVDEYLNVALANNGVSRVLGKMTDLTPMSEETLYALANSDSNYFKAKEHEVVESGKTKETTKKKKQNTKSMDKQQLKLLQKAKEKVVEILENLDVIILGTQTTDIDKAFKMIQSNPSYQNCIKEEFGLDYEVIQYLFDNHIIKKSWVDLMHRYKRDVS